MQDGMDERPQGQDEAKDPHEPNGLHDAREADDAEGLATEAFFQAPCGAP